MEKKRTRLVVGIVGIMLLISMVWMVYDTAADFITGPDFEYEREVRSHIDNAKNAKTPDLMVVELELAVDGMHNLGLNETLYSKIMHYNKVPDKTMEYQYALMDSAIQRCNEVIEWRDAQGMDSGEINDVYTAKITALKDDLGGIDNIASKAFLVNFYPWFAYWPFVFLPLMVVSLMMIVEGFVRNYDREWLTPTLAVILGIIAALLGLYRFTM